MLRYLAILVFSVFTSITFAQEKVKPKNSQTPNCATESGAIDFFTGLGYKVGSWGYIGEQTIILMYNSKLNKTVAISLDQEKSCVIFVMNNFTRT